jgi:tRNA (mo5U34)-methyltransferase
MSTPGYGQSRWSQPVMTPSQGTQGRAQLDAEAARRAIADRASWYHTIEVAPGIETPGWFDLRPIVDVMPWPDVEGKRCLEVGPYDGFLSFELERRGAAEVVAADISSPEDWDWQVGLREKGPATIARLAGTDPGAGFKVASALLGSSVERVEMSVYDLSPERLGEFDVVVCGSLLLHLKDPVRALEAIRSVCRDRFLSSETIDAKLSLLCRHRPAATLRGGERGQWWIPNVCGHRRMLEAGGFEVLRTSDPYAIPLGVAHPQFDRRRTGIRERLVSRLLTGSPSGVPHVAALARPL